MLVTKRDGTEEEVSYDKITNRLKKLMWGIDENTLNLLNITKKIINGIYNKIHTEELDILSAEICANLITEHPNYSILASRIEISNLHKKTKKKFSQVIEQLYNYENKHTKLKGTLVSKELYKVLSNNRKKINSSILYDRDYNYDYFGIKTLQRSYLMKIDGQIVERPQHMLMRVSLGIHGKDIDSAIETYNLMSEKYFTHATPTLFNSGTPRPQLSSCFLLDMQEDSIEGIYETLKQTAKISKNAGGIGLAIHKIRSNGSFIKGTNGYSNGIIPMLRVFNNTARYVDQGGGRRKGSFAMYLEPWHSDIFNFLNLRKNHGNEEERCRDLFLGLWIPDLFMKQVVENKKWYLMCPNQSPGLHECYGEEFENLFWKYVEEKRYIEEIDARKLWDAILESQIETGTPYMLYKDACNKKSNQQNLGTIKSSNLCTEIIEFTSPEECAVCNLASIGLPSFYESETNTFNYEKLGKVTRHITRNLDKIIDVNYYPIKQAENSNLKHRPIGIGVQGLADLFYLFKYPFESNEAKELNKKIFATIYYYALKESNQLAIEKGKYSSYEGSPASKGLLQFDLWNEKPHDMYNWEELREQIKKDGIRNSLLLAPMPTASTSQILGNNECFEPYTTNIYIRRTLAGEFVCINKFLLDDCLTKGIWNKSLKNKIIRNNGSIQNIDEFSKEMKDLYKTVWEIKQKNILDMAVDRGIYIDQSQSLNIYMSDVSKNKLSSMHFYGWKKGLKTGMYYLRTKPATDAIKFTVEKEETEESNLEKAKLLCSIDNKEDCLMCSG